MTWFEIVLLAVAIVFTTVATAVPKQHAAFPTQICNDPGVALDPRAYIYGREIIL